MESLKVKSIRENNIKITKEPIVYYWWFKTNIFGDLLSKVETEIEFEKIKLKTFSSTEYGLLYIGQAKNGHDRLVKYHMLDYNNFHEKGVENGRLSSLRTTLCGLLDLPMSKSKNIVNDFMDENCIVEYENCTLEELNEFEQIKIKGNYLPLNYQHTKGILTSEHRKILRESKKRMRK
ncbi:GIY-YIG nuclease family protein [uncultured Lutibacter sp.]|uniref:GIY-YIG nuclease family protein n=1 Tax=uncultured Lutibacter sp. TaxID=437739 RepID=UPI002631A01A|nr:hypothetical protein [uncultured Lutibacter sp.]